MGNEASDNKAATSRRRGLIAAFFFSAAAVVLLMATAPSASALFIPSMSAPSITAPSEGTYEPDGNFTLSGTAKFGTVSVKVVDTDAAGRYHVGTVRPDPYGRWSLNLSGVVLGKHSYRAVAYDSAGIASYWSNIRTVTVDTPQLFEKQDTNV